MANVDCIIHVCWVLLCRSSHCPRSQCDNSGQGRVRVAVGERSVELCIGWPYDVQEFHMHTGLVCSLEGWRCRIPRER
jgi:hypothetical protein